MLYEGQRLGRWKREEVRACGSNCRQRALHGALSLSLHSLA